MGRRIRRKKRGDSNVRSVAMSIHGQKVAASSVISHDESDAAASLCPFDLFQESTSSSAKYDHLARDFGALLQRLYIGMLLGGAVLASVMDSRLPWLGLFCNLRVR